MKFKYLSILIAVGSLIGLYGLSLISQPPQISLSQLPAYNGQQVLVQGIVTEYRTTASGSQLITIKDRENDTCSAVLYVAGSVAVEYGDVVQAVGEVQKYNEQWELSVSNPQSVTLVEKWTNTSFPLWQLAEHPGKYLNTNVNITGVVAQKQTSSFLLRDTAGSYSLDVSYDASDGSDFSNNDVVAVAGRFIYDAHLLRYLLEVTAPTHGIWAITR